MTERCGFVALLCAVALLAVTRFSSAAEDKDDVQKAYLDKPAGELLDHFHLRLKDLTMIDEPPAKLQGFSFIRTSDKKVIYVWLKYTDKLFSTERKWPLETIRQAKVRKVTFKPE